MSQAGRKNFRKIFAGICDKAGGLGVFLVKAFKGKSVRDGMTQTEFVTAAERYKDMIYRIALNYYGNSYDADDTVQDALLRLFRSNKRFESDEHLRSWLIRVTINLCKNGLRKARLRQHTPLEEVEIPVQFELPEQSELYRAVMALPERYRAVLYLFYYEELSVNEIAQALELTGSAVTTRLTRARRQLKTRLAEVWQDEE